VRKCNILTGNLFCYNCVVKVTFVTASGDEPEDQYDLCGGKKNLGKISRATVSSTCDLGMLAENYPAMLMLLVHY
jgi:hypothetical protein